MERNLILTVLVPVYNTEAYLDKCLGSLVVSKELMNLFEVLVVIDGSKDNSIEIARKYETNYPNTFRVIDKENGGHGSCCNVGIAEAKGKYIHFLDSDDWFDDNFSDYLLRLKEESADVVFTQCQQEKVYENRTVIHKFPSIEYDKRYRLESLKDVSFSFSLHEVSYSVALFRQFHVRFREKVYYDDVLFTVAGFLGSETVAFYDLVLYHYLLGRPGQTMDPILMSKRFNDRCYSTYDCFLLYKKSEDRLSSISKNFALRSIGWNLERVYAYSWNQERGIAKNNISILNDLFKELYKDKSFKMHYLEKMALYLPFSLGYFLYHKLLRRV